jgi:hypothetical protein
MLFRPNVRTAIPRGRDPVNPSLTLGGRSKMRMSA